MEEQQFERRRKRKQFFVFLLSYALPLVLFLYGLKCILTLHGQLLEAGQFTRFGFHFAPVKGLAAVTAGFGDITLGLFTYLSSGEPPDESRTWLWRLGRCALRWGSLVATFFLWHEAHKLRTGMP